MKIIKEFITEKLKINKHSKTNNKIIPADITYDMVFDEHDRLKHEFMESILPIKIDNGYELIINSYKIEMNGNEIDEHNYLKLCIDQKPYLTISKDKVVKFLQGNEMGIWSRTSHSVNFTTRLCKVIKFNAE